MYAEYMIHNKHHATALHLPMRNHSKLLLLLWCRHLTWQQFAAIGASVHDWLSKYSMTAAHMPVTLLM
jgi:hypothetical protein